VPHPARPEPSSTAPPPTLRHGKGGKQRVVPITDTVDDDEIRTAMTAAVAG
jgi:hypothetical protein